MFFPQRDGFFSSDSVWKGSTLKQPDSLACWLATALPSPQNQGHPHRQALPVHSPRTFVLSSTVVYVCIYIYI